MKVFISWSGELSNSVAEDLRDWLPSVIQSVEPYVSSEDIEKGTRWATEVTEELQDSRFGIICLTPENLEAPWVNFEAGALSRQIDESRVAPLLVGLKRSDVKGPLPLFQLTDFEKVDVLRLLQSINSSAEENDRLDPTRLETAFDKWWPELDGKREGWAVPASGERGEPTKLSSGATIERMSDILEEVLELSREQLRVLKPADRQQKPYLRMFSVMSSRNKFMKYLGEYEDPEDLVQIGEVKKEFDKLSLDIIRAYRFIKKDSVTE